MCIQDEGERAKAEGLSETCKGCNYEINRGCAQPRNSSGYTYIYRYSTYSIKVSVIEIRSQSYLNKLALQHNKLKSVYQLNQHIFAKKL